MEFYKRWMYHETLCPTGKIIHTPQQLSELEEGWVDTPAKFGQIKPEEPPTDKQPPAQTSMPIFRGTRRR